MVSTDGCSVRANLHESPFRVRPCASRDVKPHIRRPEKKTNETLLAPTTVVDALKIRSLAVHANRIRQHYLEADSGPTVVLLHGFPATNYVSRHQIPVLAGYYRVIAPDLRGYGETEDHPDAIAQ